MNHALARLLLTLIAAVALAAAAAWVVYTLIAHAGQTRWN